MADGGRWFKLWTSAINDPHLNDLDLADFGRWCKLGAYIKEQGNSGSITLTPPSKRLISMFQCEDFLTMMEVIRRFPNIKITVPGHGKKRKIVTEDVTIENVTYSVTFKNWNKYQTDNSAERTRRWRLKKKIGDGGCDGNRREEKRREEIYKDPPKSVTVQKRHTPPTVEEVSAYCRERGNSVDAQKWHDFYTSKGWKIGKNAMKDWKAAVRTWEKDSTFSAKAVPEDRSAW